jgi:transcriptional regulator with XRE-family HTH domain
MMFTIVASHYQRVNRKPITDMFLPVLRWRLQDILMERGLTAKDVSIKAGLGATFVADLLAGRNASPGIVALWQIAAALDLPLTDLISGLSGSVTERPSWA